MLDGWTTAGSGGDTNNVNFTPLGNTNGDATRGFIREEGNQMTFVHGSSQLIHGEDHGFSFPKTGLYVIHANFEVYLATTTYHPDFFSTGLSFNTSGIWCYRFGLVVIILYLFLQLFLSSFQLTNS